mmetsp:Transcript_106302/g.317680  ORF Transcript_106302/g.317680 Transcript_106302/m.317680 type:complete len:325 (+) Transcript_106302:699-1673(+)
MAADSADCAVPEVVQEVAEGDEKHPGSAALRAAELLPKPRRPHLALVRPGTLPLSRGLGIPNLQDLDVPPRVALNLEEVEESEYVKRLQGGHSDLVRAASQEKTRLLRRAEGCPQDARVEVRPVEADLAAGPTGEDGEGLAGLALPQRGVGAAGLCQALLHDTRPELQAVCLAVGELRAERTLLVFEARQTVVHQEAAPAAAQAQANEVDPRRAGQLLPGEQGPRVATALELCQRAEGGDEPAVSQLALLHVIRARGSAKKLPVHWCADAENLVSQPAQRSACVGGEVPRPTPLLDLPVELRGELRVLEKPPLRLAACLQSPKA